MREDEMIPLIFEYLLKSLIAEYKASKTLAQVPVFANSKNVQLGVAAGPHTQMAQNIVACFAGGASVIELKTVQIIDGENLKLDKPCIYTAYEVYNTEWSTELTVQQAAGEYIKAYILIKVLGKEFGLSNWQNITFLPSVGYDLAGIKSEKIDTFINKMKDFTDTDEWAQDFEIVKANINLFENLTIDDITVLENEAAGCDTFTLSTMHGCPADEIEAIAKYLLEEKKVNTFVKMNPTLSGRQKVSEILASKGYEVEVPADVYDQNIDLNQAVKIVKECKLCAEKCGLKFGLKMTNTLPVYIKNGELKGDRMYMSGPGLFALSVNATKTLVEALKSAGVETDGLDISFSGGADASNIKDLFGAGIKTVTVCSILLKAGGYKNLAKLLKVLADVDFSEAESKISVEKLNKLCEVALELELYKKKVIPVIAPKPDYNPLCAKCSNCVDVCPNRANVVQFKDGNKVVVNVHQLCNECGECAKVCPQGHVPYIEKQRVEVGGIKI